jgi:hypothetical protein
MPLHKTKRYRGVILTAPGWDKLQAAKTQAEFSENAGDRFTLEELSERMSFPQYDLKSIRALRTRRQTIVAVGVPSLWFRIEPE